MLVLVAVIIGFSVWGGIRTSGSGNEPMTSLNGSLLLHYAMSSVFELILVAWVALGLRLRRIPFLSLLGNLPRGLNDITKEVGIAALFWLCSMFILSSVALTWSVVQNQVYQHQLNAQEQGTKASGPNSAKTPKLESPAEQQIKMARKLMALAPSNALEIAAWGALCLIVGFSEELIFRGYLQSQGILLLRSAFVGVLFSALVFGAAHAYQGPRGMVLIGVYGALFSGIALIRRNLLPGMIAHTWHDFATGMLLAFIRETHLLEKLPHSM
jgi:membrane protease YdiL (CAAX protease family)